MPVEWTIYQLCKEFHKLPHEIEAISYEDYLTLIACMNFDKQFRKK